MKKWIILLSLFPMVAIADMRTDPMTRCLSDHTIPRILGKESSKKIVDEAYVICEREVKEWQDGRKELPEEMQAKHNKEIYDFYIRMIDIRRKAIAAKKPD
ncbi:hypothetical protein [Pectobacterium sp. B2J-2]|uniref:hypothetical protein n=1 Tax=Pectobacterium sp. B2J-2 TaxID=3385372 RepID=UPI0038FD011C